jgi:hypothetical protein
MTRNAYPAYRKDVLLLGERVAIVATGHVGRVVAIELEPEEVVGGGGIERVPQHEYDASECPSSVCPSPFYPATGFDGEPGEGRCSHTFQSLRFTVRTVGGRRMACGISDIVISRDGDPIPDQL